jgi:hypothetical protein
LAHGATRDAKFAASELRFLTIDPAEQFLNSRELIVGDLQFGKILRQKNLRTVIDRSSALGNWDLVGLK